MIIKNGSDFIQWCHALWFVALAVQMAIILSFLGKCSVDFNRKLNVCKCRILARFLGWHIVLLQCLLNLLKCYDLLLKRDDLLAKLCRKLLTLFGIHILFLWITTKVRSYATNLLQE